ncbi:putative YigZ family protein [Stackebrandtia endophytica]|uniref:Putative YigZ family protein n=1 Tax=Stackebrandtia endophytica TaxID=1496996 RepID=A0A543APY8_9ACTN|nr:YigZ family protein [Stackebrandtia endophytica]TQL74638.1 putative YigZ family protein [Stackebrandtia endophytica]
MKTIGSDTEHELVINRSRFICGLGRVDDEGAARDFVAARRKSHWNATHNCTAYRLGEQGEVQRSSDDGEPAGTAGVPMLEVLRQRELTGVVAVVTRYFGGVKLGAGGLVRAYGRAVAEAVDAAELLTLRRLTVVTVRVDYQHGGGLEAELRRGDDQLVAIRYGEGIELDVAVSDADAFGEWLASATSGQADVAVTGATTVEVAE